MRCGRAGCPLYPGGDGVPRDHRDVRDRRLPPCNGWPLPPRYRSPTRDVRLTRHQQGFRVIHPSGLPLACNPRSERAPSGFPLSFAPGRYQPRTSGRGRIWNTDPRSRLRHGAEPPIDEPTHNVRPRVALPASAAFRASAWVSRLAVGHADCGGPARARVPYAARCVRQPVPASHAPDQGGRVNAGRPGGSERSSKSRSVTESASSTRTCNRRSGRQS